MPSFPVTEDLAPRCARRKCPMAQSKGIQGLKPKLEFPERQWKRGLGWGGGAGNVISAFEIFTITVYK